MKLLIQLARTRSDILRCQYLIAETYNRAYEVVFSDDRYDLDAKVEPWPHRYLMGIVDGALVGSVGIYLCDTYVERFGKVTDSEIHGLLERAGALGRYLPARKREITKLVVDSAWRGSGVGRYLLGVAHSRCFIEVDTDARQLVVTCARRTIWENLYGRLGIHTRVIKPFPLYRVHELYRSEDDPMDSRLIISDVDVPPRYYDFELPGEIEIESARGPQ